MQKINWPILKGKLALQLCFVALLIYTCLLPFQPPFPPITSGIVAFWLVYVLSFKRERWSQIFSNPFAIAWAFYYTILLFGLLYTTNLNEAGKDIVLKISLILWPLGFSSWSEPIVKYKSKLLLVFAWVTVASSLTILSVGLFVWSNSNISSNKLFMALNIYEYLPNHYISLYASFSLFILVYAFLKKTISLKLLLLGGIPLLALLALLSVRIQLIALPIAALSFFVFYRGDKKLKKQLALIASFTIVCIITLAVLIPSTRTRIVETVDEIKSMNGMVNSKQTNHRVFLWKYGAQVISENFWFGTGTGAADAELNKKLKTCTAEFWNGHEVYHLDDGSYNYHNTYLQHFATLGIFGLVSLLALFVLPLLIFKKNLGALEAAFLTLTAIAFSTESMLERQSGVLFFGFIYSLLFVSKANSTGKNMLNKSTAQAR